MNTGVTVSAPNIAVWDVHRAHLFGEVRQQDLGGYLALLDYKVGRRDCWTSRSRRWHWSRWRSCRRGGSDRIRVWSRRLRPGVGTKLSYSVPLPATSLDWNST